MQYEFFSTTNQLECFEHVQNIRDGLPNQPECSTNVTNALRISPNALRIMIRTTFGLIRAQCDWGIMFVYPKIDCYKSTFLFASFDKDN